MLERLGRCGPGGRLPPSDVNYARECECFGSDNTVWVARLQWDPPG
jgi:hypothetical protein